VRTKPRATERYYFTHI
jgi:phytanoyl-CoA hydroxylase